jgi:5,10-methylene-tetrahydrofolate dehydrogenase/methenyl tetrahydrofolate cyclohydrolase
MPANPGRKSRSRRNQSELKPRVAALAAKGRPPGLAVVLVGNNPASEIYVRNKVKTCQDLGIHSETLTPPDSVSTGELLAMVDELNARPDNVDGILVQLPLPPQVDSKRVLLAVAPDKDVDGFHPCNVGNLVAALPGPRACTPAGILELLKRYHIPICRQARGGGGPQRHRGQAGRAAVAARTCHRHHLPFQDQADLPRCAARPTFWWRPWARRP